MSLTKGDLKAIQSIIDTRVPVIIDERIPAIILPMFDQFEERLKIQIEAGLQEVRDQVNGLEDKFNSLEAKLNGVQATVSRIEVTVGSIERVHYAELERNDRQDVAIQKIRKALHAA